jgi:hypothetical protein
VVTVLVVYAAALVPAKLVAAVPGRIVGRTPAVALLRSE